MLPPPPSAQMIQLQRQFEMVLPVGELLILL